MDCKGAWTPKPLPPTTETPQQPTNRPGGGGSGGNGGGGGGGYPGQPQPENPNPNPPYDPDRPELPGPLNPYNTNNFLRAKPEFWQQRQAVLHSELEQDIQAQKVCTYTRLFAAAGTGFSLAQPIYALDRIRADFSGVAYTCTPVRRVDAHSDGPSRGLPFLTLFSDFQG